MTYRRDFISKTEKSFFSGFSLLFLAFMLLFRLFLDF